MASEQKGSYAVTEHIKEQRMGRDVDFRNFLSAVRKLLARKWFTLGLLFSTI